MRNIKHLFFLLLIVTNNGCSQQKNNTNLNFKNSIEYSIESSSNSLNPLIQKINIIVNDGEIDSFSMNDYYNCKSTLIANRNFVNELEEVDNKTNLKQKTVKYLETGEKILDNLILPIIKHLDNQNQNEIFDLEKLKEGLILVETLVNETSDLSNSLEEFCIKYKLSKKMSDFEKEDYIQKIEVLKSKLKN
jgi:hypothetical protein